MKVVGFNGSARKKGNTACSGIKSVPVLLPSGDPEESPRLRR